MTGLGNGGDDGINQVQFARQEVFDRKDRLFGYEYFYRESPDADRASRSDTAATNAVLRALSSATIEHRTSSTSLSWFINVTVDHVLHLIPIPPHAGDVILDLPSDIPITRETIDGVRNLVERGFRICLDGCSLEVLSRQRPIVEYASFLKADISDGDLEELREVARYAVSEKLSLVGTRIETEAQYSTAQLLGCDLFQGFRFARPQNVVSVELQPRKDSCLRVLQLTADIDDVDMREVARVVSSDQGLLIATLRKNASAAYGGAVIRPAHVQQAIARFGVADLRDHVAGIIALGAARTELGVMSVLECAKFYELASKHFSVDPGSAFLAGFVIKVAPILGMSVEELLEEVRLSEDLTTAILAEHGSMHRLITFVETYRQDGSIAEADLTALDQTSILRLQIVSSKFAYAATRRVMENYSRSAI